MGLRWLQMLIEEYEGLHRLDEGEEKIDNSWFWDRLVETKNDE